MGYYRTILGFLPPGTTRSCKLKSGGLLGLFPARALTLAGLVMTATITTHVGAQEDFKPFVCVDTVEGYGQHGTFDQAIEDLQLFGYRFAECVDYLQWGNESFGGSGGYKFRDDDLSGCSFSDGTLFQNLPSQSCKEDAVDAVLAWQQDQMWAALQGSALAGRPLRMCSPGMLEDHVDTGYGDSETVAAYVVGNTIDVSNRNQMHVALHVHYTTVADAENEIEELTGTGDFTSPPWDTPNWTVATEVGTTADFSNDWWTTGVPAPFTDYQGFFFTDGDDPSMNYEPFTAIFAGVDGQYDDTDGPELDPVFDLFDSTGFTAVCYSALQYGMGTYALPSKYLIEALRGNKVREDFLNDPDDRYTALKTLYENAASEHAPTGTFDPHSCECQQEDTCPGCE